MTTLKSVREAMAELLSQSYERGDINEVVAALVDQLCGAVQVTGVLEAIRCHTEEQIGFAESEAEDAKGNVALQWQVDCWTRIDGIIGESIEKIEATENNFFNKANRQR